MRRLGGATIATLIRSGRIVENRLRAFEDTANRARRAAEDLREATRRLELNYGSVHASLEKQEDVLSTFEDALASALDTEQDYETLQAKWGETVTHQIRILALLKQAGPLDHESIAVRLQLNEPSVRRAMQKLREHRQVHVHSYALPFTFAVGAPPARPVLVTR